MIAAQKARVVAFDNISTLPTWLSDAICRISTGGGFSTRRLFENDEEIIFEAQLPVILNGIEDLATRSDLLDRAIQVTLVPIPEGQRRTEAAIESEFLIAYPRLLGALLDAVSMALRNYASVSTAKLPRMADFARWVVAAEPALPFSPGAFARCYIGNREDAHVLALEASPIYPAIHALVKAHGSWTGTAAELLRELNDRFEDGSARPYGWPKAPNTLSNLLRRIAPNLRASGTEVEFLPRTGSAGRQLRIAERLQSADTDRHPRPRETLKPNDDSQSAAPGDEAVTMSADGPISAMPIGDDSDDGLPNSSVEATWTL